MAVDSKRRCGNYQVIAEIFFFFFSFSSLFTPDSKSANPYAISKGFKLPNPSPKLIVCYPQKPHKGPHQPLIPSPPGDH
jgi:hypothetical protein